MHVSQLFWMLMPLDQPWHPDDRRTVNEELCAEPHRAVWLLSYRPSELLWGQGPNLPRVQAWTRLCEGVHRGMAARLADMAPMPGDPFDERARASLGNCTPPSTPVGPAELADLSEGWLRHAHRSQEAMSSLAARFGPSAAPDPELQAALGELAIARERFVSRMPYLRDALCDELTASVKVHALSVGLVRSVCRYAAAEFSDAEQQRDA